MHPTDNEGIATDFDRAVVEGFGLGLGAMTIEIAPAQLKSLGEFLPTDYRDRSAQLLAGQHPQLADLDCRAGLLARAVLEYRQSPIIGPGMLDIECDMGRLGGGIYDMPTTVFSDAMAALEPIDQC